MKRPSNPFRLLLVMTGSTQTGGGYHQTITNLEALIRIAPAHYVISVLDVSGSYQSALAALVSQGELKPEQLLRVPQRFDSFRDRLITSGGAPYRFGRWLLRMAGRRIGMSPAARFIDHSDASLVYFLSGSPIAQELEIKPFIWTMWDICHLDSPEFPEVRTSHKFEDREAFYSTCLRKAVAVVLDSKALMLNTQRAFSLHTEKFVVIPFSPPATLQSSALTHQRPAALAHVSSPYFFYPAQLWTHKNHVRIAEAIARLKSEGHDYHAVFVGKDHGAGPRVRARVESLGVTDRVHFLGYVSDAEMASLYSNASALVMASYFGPTNIPPLEGFQLSVPVIASSIHQDQLRDGALYFDPDDEETLTQAMLEVQTPRTREKLIAAGIRRLNSLAKERYAGQEALLDLIRRLSKRIL